MVVCIRGSAIISLSRDRAGTDIVLEVPVHAGDIYAITDLALESLFHAVLPDPLDPTPRVALTLRRTLTDYASESDFVR